jgi:hypothetical protein
MFPLSPWYLSPLAPSAVENQWFDAGKWRHQLIFCPVSVSLNVFLRLMNVVDFQSDGFRAWRRLSNIPTELLPGFFLTYPSETCVLPNIYVTESMISS